MDEYINISKVAEVKGLKSTRAIRLKIQNGQYIAREVNVRGGKSYEILFESLGYDIQALVKQNPEPYYYPAIPTKSFVPDTAKTIALARIDLIKQWVQFRNKHNPKSQGDKLFLEMYNSGEFLKRLFKIIGTTSRGSLQRWKLAYDEFGTWESLAPQYKYSSMPELSSCFKIRRRSLRIFFSPQILEEGIELLPEFLGGFLYFSSSFLHSANSLLK